MSQEGWCETTATVYSCGWEETPGRFLTFHQLSDLFSGHYIVLYSYVVNGNHYSGEFKSSTEWQEGSSFQLKYNPQNPDETDRQEDSDRPAMTFISWVVGIALVGLYLWCKHRR